MDTTKVKGLLKDYSKVIATNLVAVLFVCFLFHIELAMNQGVYFSVYCIIGYAAYLCWFIHKEVQSRSQNLYQIAFSVAETDCKKQYAEKMRNASCFPLKVTEQLKIYCIELVQTRETSSDWTIVGEHNGELFSVEITRGNDETLESMMTMLGRVTEPTEIIELDQKAVFNNSEFENQE
ncbi:MAG: hypothetical protein FWF82_04985 [Oscillospiraceae bacterium]|nr:hypothetical protein [Oscillospiraceae bacterium]